MTESELDVLWQRALQESVAASEPFTRYRFAALVRAQVIEEAAQRAESDEFYGSALQHDIAYAIRGMKSDSGHSTARAGDPSTTPLPCPFCGGTSVSVQEGSTFRWRYASCNECGAQAGEVCVQTMGEGTREEWEEKARRDAMAEWNTRTAGTGADNVSPGSNEQDKSASPSVLLIRGEK